MEVPRQIPPRNGNFVDRETVLAAVKSHVADTVGNATVVIEGLPGVGKTALATELTHRFSNRYGGGQLLFRLSKATPIPELLANAVVALGLERDEVPDVLEALHARYLTLTAGRRMLVVVDGAATAAEVSWLEPADGGSLIVVTGRNSATDLSRGGRVFELEPLPIGEARKLLGLIVGEDRVAAEPQAVDRLLALCACMPFALCVVGSMLARHRNRKIGKLADLLSNDQRRSTALSLPEIFDAAYAELSETAQRCYRALGLRSHAGTLSSVALATAAGVSPDEIDWYAMELVDLHLIAERDQGFDVIDLVAIHSRGLGTAGDSRAHAEERLLEHYDRGLNCADSLIAPNRPWRELLFPGVHFPGPGTGEFSDADGAREWLRREHGNLVAALGYAAEVGLDQLVARWCVLLWPFQEQDKRLESMLIIHAFGIAAAERSGMTAVASFLHTQVAFVPYWRRDAAQAAASFECGVCAARSLSPSILRAQLEASALEGLGLAQLISGDIPRARETLRQNYQLALRIEDDRRCALAALHLAKVEEPARALELLDSAGGFFATVSADEPDNRAKVMLWRGRKLLEQRGRAAVGEAEELLNAALTIMTERVRRFDEAEILVALGDCAVEAGNGTGAVEHYRAGHAIYAALGLRDSAAAAQTSLEAARKM